MTHTNIYIPLMNELTKQKINLSINNLRPIEFTTLKTLLHSATFNNNTAADNTARNLLMNNRAQINTKMIFFPTYTLNVRVTLYFF